MHKLLLFFFLLLTTTGFSQDSSTVRTFDATKMEEYAANKQYDYTTEEKKSKPNAFLQGLGDLFKSIGKFLFSTPGVILMIVLLLGGISYAYRGAIFKKKTVIQTSTKGIPVVISEDGVDYEKLRNDIELSVQNQDYKTAIRHLYVLVILSLSQEKLIHFHIEKTNSDYKKELPKNLRGSFQQLTLIFDYVWYGDYPANEKLFSQAKQHVATLNKGKHVA